MREFQRGISCATMIPKKAASSWRRYQRSVRSNLRDPIKHILRDLNKIMGILRKETFFVVGKDQPVVDQ